jgi:hypothetical protein
MMPTYAPTVECLPHLVTFYDNDRPTFLLRSQYSIHDANKFLFSNHTSQDLRHILKVRLSQWWASPS